MLLTIFITYLADEGLSGLFSAFGEGIGSGVTHS